MEKGAFYDSQGKNFVVVFKVFFKKNKRMRMTCLHHASLVTGATVQPAWPPPSSDAHLSRGDSEQSRGPPLLHGCHFQTAVVSCGRESTHK